MIPLLLISKSTKLIKKYVDNLKVDNLFFEILPSTKEFSIEDIKGLMKDTKIFNPKTRVYFLSNFNRSSIPAQNSFLKLLEEPPPKIQFILSADSRNSLLPTIISRVKIIKLRGNYSQNVVGAQFIVPEIIGLKIPLASFKIADRESAQNILSQLITYFRQKLGSDNKAVLIIKEALRLNRLLENNNLNPQLTIDEVLIFIWKMYRMN